MEEEEEEEEEVEEEEEEEEEVEEEEVEEEEVEEGGSKKKKNTHPWRVEKFHLVIITTINQWTNEHKSTSRLISPLLFVTRIIVTHLLPIWSVVLVQVNIVVHAHQHGNFLCKTRELARITHPLASSLTPCPHNNKPKKFTYICN